VDGARDEAVEALEALSADRQTMSRLVCVPQALMAAFGALGAWWVGLAASVTPGENYEPPLTAWLALLGALVVAHLVQRETGIRFGSLGARASWAILGSVAACLGLFSVSLGLVSLGLTWTVVLTSVAAFAITTWLAGVACRNAVEHLGRG
jgi:hypothetical protein